MLKKKFSVLYIVLAVFVGSFSGIALMKYFDGSLAKNTDITSEKIAEEDCHYKISRMTGYKYINPVYMTEPECESKDFIPLKSDINDLIERMKTTGDLEYASVYLKNLNSNYWMDINPENTYHPGSLFKVITMITFLRMAETNLAILEKEVAYKNKGMKPPTQTFNSKTIISGNTYKIKDLLYYMIVYSDNNATMLLHDFMNIEIFQKIFTDLGLKKPNVYDNSYQLSVEEYSRFISVLYDGTYLTMPASEFAISMLCKSDFNLGITKELPASVTSAHKFGEAGKPGNRELHESAIIYLNNKPYLLTIMTKGKESVKLAEIMSHISKIVYDHMVALSV
ncbi:MAG: class A beta-lactamase-related serine hydrolase [Taibaiella sp.]|nr:class A beta-lactamase-related serine hydrolase [Taibaiella sp.]